MVKFVTATFWLGKPFCPLPFLSDCWVTISVVMEWNGMELDMAHGLVTMVDWALGSGGSLSLDDDDDRWPMMMMYPPTSSPPTQSYVRPCLHTSSLPRVTRVSALVVVVDDGWRCVGDRLTRRPWMMWTHLFHHDPMDHGWRRSSLLWVVIATTRTLVSVSGESTDGGERSLVGVSIVIPKHTGEPIVGPPNSRCATNTDWGSSLGTRRCYRFPPAHI